MKNALTTLSDNLTMSSREIADLVESRHDSVKRTIERLQEKGVIQLTPLVEVKNHLGQMVTEYNLIKRDTYIVVAQLCPEFTARLVDRWQALENQIDPMKMLNDPSTMRGLLLNYSEKVIALEEKVEEMAPTVQAFDRIATKSEGAMCITDAAKHLQVKPLSLFTSLSVNRWIYKRAGNKHWIAYQDKLQQGLLEHKIHVAIKEDGSEKVCEQVLLTAKGLTKMASLLNIKAAA